MPRDINAQANLAFAAAIELVLQHYGLDRRERAGWTLLVYPDDQSEPTEIGLVSNSSKSQVEHVLRTARQQMQASAGDRPDR